MRTLNFIVKDQIITKDPNCDFGGLVPGTNDYIRAHFSFSPEWDKYGKVATFWSMLGKEYTPQIIMNGTCKIPTEALKKMRFKVQVSGIKDGSIIKTNKVTVCQDGGKS